MVGSDPIAADAISAGGATPPDTPWAGITDQGGAVWKPAAYLAQLQALMPRGPAWPDEPDATLSKLLAGLAEELARIDGRAAVLLDEADPRATTEMLPDWERAFGLPSACMSGVSQTLQQRRNALVSQMTAVGGQSRQYFIDIAAAAGFTITITEFRPTGVGMAVNDPIYGTSWRFAWQVNAPAVTSTWWTVVSGVGEPLQAWGNQLLECLLGRYKPAHTTLIFAYS